MTDNNAKTLSGFRRLLQVRFFNAKSKDRGKSKNGLKTRENVSSSIKSNHYQDPRALVGSNDCLQKNSTDSEVIYENLSVTQKQYSHRPRPVQDVASYHSSSSTLVSMSTNKTDQEVKMITRDNPDQFLSTMRQNDYSPPRQFNDNCYPDVYFHSMEGIKNNISPLDDIEIYKACRNKSNPEPVGAEIKRVSTKYLISPKKEAEVRSIQPKTAQSISFSPKTTQDSKKTSGITKEHYSKPYNYSAPTSPLPVNHRIPTRPFTASPYEYVRKNIADSELHSLNKNNMKINQEKGCLNMEAYYWQKLKELKQKEDEQLNSAALTLPVGCSIRNTIRPTSCNPSYSSEKKIRNSLSDPRNHNSNSATFVRGAPERRTDSYIMKRVNCTELTNYPKPNFRERTVSDKKINNLLQEHIQLRTLPTSKESVRDIQFPEEFEIAYSSRNEIIENLNGVKYSGVISKIPPQIPKRTTSIKKYTDGENKTFTKTQIADRARVSEYGPLESANKKCEISSRSETPEKQSNRHYVLEEDDWRGDSRIDGGLSDGEASRGPSRGRTSRRDDPRRHTLAGNHLYVHPHYPNQINSIDVDHSYGQQSMTVMPEYATVVKYRDSKQNQMLDQHTAKPALQRNYQPTSNAMLFDDDPGIMSEVETSSTGFRRGGKQRSSLPVVRTPSKTLERPLGLVFLQYRNETKRALLPNEITSIDTVKALFVRSFPKQLTMQYMDSPMVKIYIHDSSKDMFYELEDVRTHLRDIRDRSVLRLFEATDMGGGVFPGAVGVGSLAMPPAAAPCSGPSSWDQDQNYFSEPEIDSEYHHQHIHKSKVKAPAYYIGSGPASSTLPRGGSILRTYSPAAPPVPADRVKTLPPSGHSSEGYMSSPERGGARPSYEDPYYTQFIAAAGRPTITPVIDEEASDGVIIDESYQMYGVNPLGSTPRPLARPPYDNRINPQMDEMQRLRVEKMERQLANLTGLVQKALQVPPPAPAAAPRHDFPYTPAPRPQPADAARITSIKRPPKLGRDKFQKSVSFEKSVSFSDDPPDMNSPKQHSPQHSADTKPTKPAIKSSTLPRTSSQERERLKPAPPPKPAGLAPQPAAPPNHRSPLFVSPEFFNQLRLLHRQCRDLRLETRNMRRSTLGHAIQIRQLMAETIVKIGALSASCCENDPQAQLAREEEIYRQDMLLLENDLFELEATVERLRGQAANRETRVNMADIERIAMVLSKSSKTVADWKLKFPILQDTMKVKLASEMEKVVRKEKMLEEEPERLELALRRCKKLTGTLVTLKRLACVQEQRLPLSEGRLSPGSSQGSSLTAPPSSDEFNSDTACHLLPPHNKGAGGCGGRGAGRGELRPENALDALLDELQTFAHTQGERAAAPPALRRLHSYPSGSDTDASPPVRARGQHPPKPPVPERHPELLALAARRAPPPPPPRTTSRSPLASPPSPASPPQDAAARHAALEQRHHDLLKKQRALQEQYARLQMIQRSAAAAPPAPHNDLKKTGSESNLLTKMSLNLAPVSVSGSMSHIPLEANGVPQGDSVPDQPPPHFSPNHSDAVATTNKVYETEIL